MTMPKPNKRPKIALSLLLLFIAACNPITTTSNPQAASISDPFSCAAIQSGTGPVMCIETSAGASIIQTNGEQITLSFNTITLSFTDTVYLIVDNDRLLVSPLSGSAVVSATGRSQTLQNRTQSYIPLKMDGVSATGPPSDATITSPEVIIEAYYNDLPRQITLTFPVPTPNRTLTNNDPTPCPMPDGWNTLHTVVRGDTLTEIATTYGTTLDALQRGNCITDADSLLLPGDTLFVPGGLPNTTTFTAATARITADSCTLLQWETTNASAVTLDDDPVPVNGSYNACPIATKTYTLRVVYRDGAQIEYPLTLTVE